MAAKQVPLMLTVPKECRDRLRQMAAERNLQNPNKVVAASTIARELVLEGIERVEQMEANLDSNRGIVARKKPINPLTQGGNHDMTSTAIIQNQSQFINNATEFFQTIFEPTLNSGHGDIEIRTFPKDRPSQQFFCKSESEAALTAGNLCNSGIDVYFGVNPRVGNAGKKENVHYLVAFHAEVDYGTDGHKQEGASTRPVMRLLLGLAPFQ